MVFRTIKGGSWVSLVAAAVLLSLAGCASKDETPAQIRSEAYTDIEADMRAAVSDPARAEQAVALLNELDTLISNSRTIIQSHKANVRAFNRDYDSQRSDFEREFEAIDQEIRNFNSYFLRISSEVRELLNEDEIKEIEKTKNKYLEVAISSLRTA